MTLLRSSIIAKRVKHQIERAQQATSASATRVQTSATLFFRTKSKSTFHDSGECPRGSHDLRDHRQGRKENIIRIHFTYTLSSTIDRLFGRDTDILFDSVELPNTTKRKACDATSCLLTPALAASDFCNFTIVFTSLVSAIASLLQFHYDI